MQDADSNHLQLRVRELTEALEVCTKHDIYIVCLLAAMNPLMHLCMAPAVSRIGSSCGSVRCVEPTHQAPASHVMAVHSQGAVRLSLPRALPQGACEAHHPDSGSNATVGRAGSTQGFQKRCCAAQDQHHGHEAELSGLQVELQRSLARAEVAEAEVAARPPAEELRCRS